MRVRLNNVGVISDCDLEFVPGINLIVGSSGSGKSTLMRSIYNLVSNEFSDSDISFGKNTMHVRVDYNDSFVEYSRSLKAKGERCYYIVDNNQYVKLGRQPLQAVTDVLNIGDIEISGDNVNFNFNLQFSSPFLILGSQSTLYKVLTYRSTFDISSINDIYSTDIKNNANEISSHYKLKERFEDSLESLNNQAMQLSSIEDLYSNYMTYKHRLNTKNEIESLLGAYNYSSNAIKLISDIDCINSHIDIANALIIRLNDLLKLTYTGSCLSMINDKIKLSEELLDKLNTTLQAIQSITDLRSMLDYMIKVRDIDFNITTVDIALSSKLDIDIYAINDIVKQSNLFKAYHNCDRILHVLSNKNDDVIHTVNDLMLLNEKLHTLYAIDNKLSEISKLNNDNHEELSKFKICPLCGQSINENCVESC